jgi:peroxiredoxin
MNTFTKTSGNDSGQHLFYIGCIMVLLLTNGLAIWKILQQREVSASDLTRPRAVESLLSSPLKDTSGNSITLSETTARYVVLFLFQPTDCPPCLTEMTDLNRISRSRPDIAVYGVISHANLDEAQQTRKNLKIEYPILGDPGGLILQSLALPTSPYKIVLQTRPKKIIYEDPRSETDSERISFMNRVIRLP